MVPLSNLPNGFEEFSRATEKQFADKSMRMTISVSQNFRVRFNIAAVDGLELQTFIKFFRFKNTWYVVKTRDGYSLSVEKTHRTGASCSCIITARTMIKDFNVQGQMAEFYLLLSEHEYDGHRLYQLNRINER